VKDLVFEFSRNFLGRLGGRNLLARFSMSSGGFVMGQNTRKSKPWFLIMLFLLPAKIGASRVNGADFDAKAFAALPVQQSYNFVKVLSEGVDPERGERSPAAKPTPAEMAIASTGWTLLIGSDAGMPLRNAASDVKAYLGKAMDVQIRLETPASIRHWSTLTRAIVVGTRDQMPGCGAALTGPKDYQIMISAERIAVCGFDEAGAMYGLYNLEERISLREGPFLPRSLNAVRHSLYKARMTLSGIGWMEWPDKYLAMLPRYGFDSIYASGYANPDGSPAPGPYYDRMRRQDPAAMHDLIRRAARYGIRVYCPVMYYYNGTSESKAGLRKLIRHIVTEFPEIRGYVLLTEGFDAATSPWEASNLHQWVKEWAEAVQIVTTECHKLNPKIEILPWDYNINFRPSQVALKTFVIDQLPRDTIPLVTFVNGKGVTFDGEHGYVRDYSISQIGPSEVAAAQIAETKKRRMQGIYAKADTWATWQFGTFPYLPFPYQWYARYQVLRKYGIEGTMESWSYGFKPNFVSELRTWYSWSDAPPLDELLREIARRDFGPNSVDLVLNAWKDFSAAIRLDPDTGPSEGGNNAVANPLFFEQPKEHIITFEHSWTDQKIWSRNSYLNPYWPYVRHGYFDGYVLYPDFTNHLNVADEYVKPFTLPVFTKYLLEAADKMDEGLSLYRQAALESPTSKRHRAYHEVLLAEQIERMMRSNDAVLEFENLRFHLAKTNSSSEQREGLDRMTTILKQEITRTDAALETAERDSRLGYEWEEDYMYWPQTLKLKLELLHLTLDKEIPAYRRQHGLD
jgi:hypothetical protein